MIAWITNEKREDQNQTDGLEAVRKEIDAGETVVVVSALARTEVFRLGLTEEQKTKYREFFNRRNAIEQDVTGAIAEKAAEIRRKSQKTRVDGATEMMKTPDAIHIATAIILDAAEFQTFDGTAKKPRPFSLIPFSGSTVVDGMKICVPSAPIDAQSKLPFGPTEASSST
jgi:hypothetical protein